MGSLVASSTIDNSLDANTSSDNGWTVEELVIPEVSYKQIFA